MRRSIIAVLLTAIPALAGAQNKEDMLSVVKQQKRAGATTVMADEIDFPGHAGSEWIHLYKYDSSGARFNDGLPLDHPWHAAYRHRLDVFGEDQGKIVRLQSVFLGRRPGYIKKDVQRLVASDRNKLVLILRFHIPDGAEICMIPFPGGPAAPAPCTSEFTEDPHSQAIIANDGPGGKLRLTGKWSEDPEKPPTVQRVYDWNGFELACAKEKWFHILSSDKTLQAAQQSLCKWQLLLGCPDVRKSDWYPGLKKGYWVVIAGRYLTKGEALEDVAETGGYLKKALP